VPFEHVRSAEPEVRVAWGDVLLAPRDQVWVDVEALVDACQETRQRKRGPSDATADIEHVFVLAKPRIALKRPAELVPLFNIVGYARNQFMRWLRNHGSHPSYRGSKRSAPT
jgi:hypothetical protein